MMVFVRNLHPTKRLAVPISDGLARIVPPGATTTVPIAALALPAVARLLDAQLAATVGRAGWDADLRQRCASRFDIARAIAAAEQKEFDRLRAGLAPQRPHFWPPERIEWLRTRLAAGATITQLAGELGRSRQAVGELARRHGLEPCQRPQGVRRPTTAPRPVGAA